MMKPRLSPFHAFWRKALPVAVAAGLTGSAGAFFLWALDAVTRVRVAGPGWLWALPLLGWGVAVLYARAGGRSGRGTGLILDEVHEPGAGVPARMAPLIVLGTLATHLGGGSAGREGTAVQMGGALASGTGRWLRGLPEHHAGLLMAGVAAGFGAVFGTPWAGAVFALEVLRRKTGRWQEWPWCLAAAWLADRVCHAWGAAHARWPAGMGFSLTSPGVWLKLAGAAVCFGLLARFFVRTAHGLQESLTRWVPRATLRPVLGGLGVIALVYVSGTRDFLGLGTLPATPGGLCLGTFFQGDGGFPAAAGAASALGAAGAAGSASALGAAGGAGAAGMSGEMSGFATSASGGLAWAWVWKLAFTLMTVGFGFKGGEVTPLFFMGAALGHSLSLALGLPGPPLAALGMVAVFGAAARTPWACAVMGMELFGWSPGLGIPLVAVCALAAAINKRGLYH